MLLAKSLRGFKRQDWPSFFLSSQLNPISYWQRTFTSRMKIEKLTKKSLIDYAVKPSDIPGILLQRTGPAHLSAVQTLLWESFFQSEPLVAALGGPPDRDFADNEAKMILQRLSLVAIEEASGRILAAAINRTVTPQEMKDWTEKIDQITCSRTRRLARFYHSISMDPDIFKTYYDPFKTSNDPFKSSNSPPAYVEITFLVTASAARGMGLASLLLKESLSLTRETRTPLAVIYCTNTASARLVEKVTKMKRIGGRRVEEYFQEEEDRREIREKLTPSDDEIRVYAMSFDDRITL